MENLKQGLKIKLQHARKIAVLGIGSELRGDDAAGVLAARQIRGIFCKDNSNIEIITGGAAPENFTGHIKRFKPSHIIIIDAAQLNKEPGSVAVLSSEDISGFSFSTHRMPTSMLVNYINEAIKCKVVIIGIQPKSIEWGEVISSEVKNAVGLVSEELQDLFKDIFKKQKPDN